jgi:hypothetical protein
MQIDRLLVILVVVVLGLDSSLGDTVQITLARLGDTTATLLLVVLENTDLLQGLNDLSVDRSGSIDVVGGTGATVLDTTVDLAQTADTDSLADVDVTGDSSGADVEPDGADKHFARNDTTDASDHNLPVL